MDALRFLGGVRPAAPPQPPVAPASVAPPPVQRQQQQARAAIPRMWPRGERPGGEVRGEEAGARPEAEERRQGNWVLQMLRVQPRWADQADAEAAGAGGGGGGGGQEDDAPDVSGAERCASCGGGDDEEEGCAVGADEGGGEVFDRASFSRLLRKVSIEDAKEYSRMSYLCNIAYMIPKIQVRSLLAALPVTCTSPA